MLRGQLGGMTAGIRSRIRKLGLNSDIEKAVLNAVTRSKKTSRFMVKMPRKVQKRICEALLDGQSAVVSLGGKNGKKWSIHSVQSYLSKINAGKANMAKMHHEKNGIQQYQQEAINKLMTGV